MTEPGRTVVFFHAHPDDEAIFTGGTMALLAAAGWRVVLVLATAGEQGLSSALVGPEVPWPCGGRARRRQAAECLGAQRVEFLGYHDSGVAGAGRPPGGAFADSPVAEAADRLAGILAEERPGRWSATTPGGSTATSTTSRSTRWAWPPPRRPVYRRSTSRRSTGSTSTSSRPIWWSRPRSPRSRSASVGLGLAAAPLGLSTVEVDCTVDVRPVLPVKRQAMAAHASQIPETSSAMRLPDADFAAVYGYEWYARRGPVGPIDDLA